MVLQTNYICTCSAHFSTKENTHPIYFLMIYLHFIKLRRTREYFVGHFFYVKTAPIQMWGDHSALSCHKEFTLSVSNDSEILTLPYFHRTFSRWVSARHSHWIDLMQQFLFCTAQELRTYNLFLFLIYLQHKYRRTQRYMSDIANLALQKTPSWNFCHSEDFFFITRHFLEFFVIFQY